MMLFVIEYSTLVLVDYPSRSFSQMREGVRGRVKVRERVRSRQAGWYTGRQKESQTQTYRQSLTDRPNEIYII